MYACAHMLACTYVLTCTDMQFQASAIHMLLFYYPLFREGKLKDFEERIASMSEEKQRLEGERQELVAKVCATFHFSPIIF